MKTPEMEARLVPARLIAAGLIGGLALAASSPAFAQSTGALYACAAMTDTGARLACFDAEVARLKAAEAGGEVAVVTREEVKEAERESFGLSGAEAPALAAARPKVAAGPAAEEKRLSEVKVTVVEAEKRLDGKVRFTTSDGQVWVQTDTTDPRVRGEGPWQASIKVAMLGSFMIKLDGARAVKVRREQ